MIWNPWKAAKQAEQEVTRLRDIIAERDEELTQEQHRRQTDRKEFDLRQRILKAEIDRLTSLLKDGHFRNPKTGRLGRKGERFK